MNKLDTQAAQLSRFALDALKAVRSTRQGGPTGAVGPAMRELLAAGMIGESGGLTRQGSVLAEKLRRQAEDDAFGGLS